MSSIKIVDVNETEEVKEEVKEEEEEAPKEEETKEEPKKRMKSSDRITCTKCKKTVSFKTWRYRHEKQCMNKEPVEERPMMPVKPVKPQAKPKPKALPKSNLQNQRQKTQLKNRKL